MAQRPSIIVGEQRHGNLQGVDRKGNTGTTSVAGRIDFYSRALLICILILQRVVSACEGTIVSTRQDVPDSAKAPAYK